MVHRTLRARVLGLATLPTALVICGCVPAPVLVKDLQTATDGSYPSFTASSSGVYAVVTNGTVGRELLFSDGTPAKYQVVTALGKDGAGSWPTNVFTNGDRAFFAAKEDGDPNSTNWGIYVTDGTAASTARLVAPSSTLPSDLFTPFATWGANGVLFTSTMGNKGVEIWRSDGTVAGTQIVADISAGAGGSMPAEMTKLGSYYYFAAADATGDRELWRTDGTNTNQVLNLNASGSSQPRGLAVWNNKLYFGADQGATFRRGLYASDGTAANTVLITDKADDNFRPETLTAAQGQLFFMAYYQELWVTDGTAGGTKFVQTFDPNSEGEIPTEFKALGSRVLFYVPTDTGRDLWSSDGTTAGTVLLASDLEGGTGLNAVYGGKFYYPSGDAIYRTDGTVAGTTLVYTQAGLAPSGLTPALGKILFAGSDATHGAETWSTDGTTTKLTGDYNTSTTSSYPTSFVRAGNLTFFTADVTGLGRELYVTDGTPAGTSLVKDIRPGATGSNPTQMKGYNGVLYFVADDGSHGTELWRSDGTAAGTTLLKDIRAGVTPTAIGDVYPGPNYLYFYADDGTNGAELWRSDGTAAGTVMVKDINAGAAASTPRWFATLGSKVCFAATTAAEGRELWCSDGTSAGTVLAKDIRSGTTSGANLNEAPVVLGSYVYFQGTDATNGAEVWRSDGTSAGTTRVTDLVVGQGSSTPVRFAVMNGGVFFVAYDGSRWEMWRTTGSTPTMITGSINSSPYSNPGSLTVAGGSLFFIANHPTAGVELFKTDGTAAGVQLVKDINPAAGKTSSPNYLTAVSNLVFFSANDGTTGTELWSSDGTPEGTALVTGQDGDAHASNPTQLAESGGQLFVNVDDVNTGQEPYVVSP